MYLLHTNNWSATSILRGLLAIIFILWLTSVLSQYDNNEIENRHIISAKHPPSNVVIEQLSLPPVPNTKVQTLVAVPKFSEQSPELIIEETIQSSPVNKQHIQQVYQQLSEQGIDIQIAWPQQPHQQQAALDFMYQCAGMQFAVLNGNILNKVNHTKVNQIKLSEYSDWIRVAQGSLSTKEQHWLNAYALTGTAIRLFPREIDFRLAQHLANTLRGAPIASLRATYQVSHQRLHLTQIRVNNQPVKGSWTLYQSECD